MKKIKGKLDRFYKTKKSVYTKKIFKTLQNTTFTIVGCGGIAHPLIVYLVGAGAKKFVLIDNDEVHVSNLNRQFIFHPDHAFQKIYKAVPLLQWIKTFADKETQRLFLTGKSQHLPPDLIKRAIRRLEYLHYAITLNDLVSPPSNRLHALKGNREGQHSISISDKWRICFLFINGDAYDVEITDYH